MGTMIGDQDDVPMPPRGPRGRVRREIERVVRSALDRPPCVVSFSGGRDSSCLLALACSIARRDGLNLPIPATVSYPGDPDTYEDDWQHLVISYLNLNDWVRIDAPSPDAVGADAMWVARRIGLKFPSNGYLTLPVARIAAGGALVTGIGGDELFGSASSTWLRLVLRREPVTWRSVRRAASDLRLGRSRREALSVVEGEAWLRRPAATAAVKRQILATKRLAVTEEPAYRRWLRSRYYQSCVQTIDRISQLGGAEAFTPFLDPRVVVAVGAEAGLGGFPSRTEAMSRFFADVAPSAVVHRTTKAVFNRSLASASTHAFVQSWDGSGVDAEIVDPVLLRRIWSQASPDFRSQMLLQQAALATGWEPE